MVRLLISGTVLALALSLSGAASAAPAPGYGTGPGYCTSYSGGVTSSYSFQDVYACQGTTTGTTTFDAPGANYYAWQCVELSARFLWAIDGIWAGPGSGVQNGADLVSVIGNKYSLPVAWPGPGSVPAAGDVISFQSGGDGHTAVVTSANSSTGAFEVMSENDPLGKAGEQSGSVDLGGGHNGDVSFQGHWVPANWLVLSNAGGGGPSAPSSLSATTDQENSATLDWSASSGGVGGVASYKIIRNGFEVASVSGGTGSYQDSAISPGMHYVYSVVAVDTDGNDSAPSPTVEVDFVQRGQGSFELGARYGPTYCRQTGAGPNLVQSYLECTFFNGKTWTHSSSNVEDWGASTGWAWVSDHGNPAYCRQTGSGPNLVQSYLECTVFNGKTWTHSSSNIEDWGASVGWAWVSDHGNPAYCRQTGSGPNFVQSYLECTVFNGKTWKHSSSNIEDWGASTGWAWVSDHGNPAYCRQTGSGPNLVQSYLECTVFNGKTWTHSSSNTEDWGASIGWAWVSAHGNPAYCRQTGSGPNFVQSYLECTIFNGKTWTHSSSNTEDWGAPVHLGWLSSASPLQKPRLSRSHAVLGRRFIAILTEPGGAAPFVWVKASGSLPHGLSLTRAGVIAGTPRAVGAFHFRVRVQDTAGQADSVPIAISVTN